MTHTVVGRLDWDVTGGTDQFDLWIDPTAESDPATVTRTGTALTTDFITDISITHFGNGGTGQIATMDWFALGDTFDSVINPVFPEPSTFGLLAVTGVFAAIARMRRR